MDNRGKSLAPTAPVEASGSEREHGPKCCGKTSISDEMMYCYCGSTDARPQPSGETREALDRLKMAAHVYEDDEMAADCATLEALLSARPLALGGQKGNSETLRVLLDNLVIAQTLSKDIRQKATDEARSYLYDLRHTPQPSGETREDDLVEMLSDWFERIPGFQDTGQGTIKGRYPTGFQDVEFGHIALAKDILALLSARPLALGGQHSTATDFPPDDVLACDITPARAEAQDEQPDITPYTEDLKGLKAAMQAEAQDEGAAGEPVAWRCRYVGAGREDWLFREVAPDPAMWTEVQPLYAHPSPTPAADADRVREAQESSDAEWLKDLLLDAMDQAPSECEEHGPNDHDARIMRILAALKSTAAKEGGE